MAKVPTRPSPVNGEKPNNQATPDRFTGAVQEVWQDHDIARYRWNLKDHRPEEPLVGFVCDRQYLPDGDGGEYDAIVVLTTEPTTARDDAGELGPIPPETFVVLSFSDGLRPIWPTLVKMAEHPTSVRKVRLSHYKEIKTSNGFNVIKVKVATTANPVSRDMLPVTPNYGRLETSESFPALNSGTQTPMAEEPVGSYAG